MEVATEAPSIVRPVDSPRLGLVVLLIAVSCALSTRAEIFVIGVGVLTLLPAASSSRDALWHCWRSINRRVLAGTVVMGVLWAYGFALGLLEGYPTGHVIRNFFGLAFFLPALLSASLLIGRAGVARIAVRSGQCALALLVVLRVGSIFDLVPLGVFQFFGVPVGLSDFGLRIYSFGAFPIFGWQGVVAQRLYQSVDAGEWQKAGRLALQSLLIIAGTWFVTESKGILLGSFAVLGVPLVLQLRWTSHVRYAAVAVFLVMLEMQVIMPASTYIAINWLGLKPSEIMAGQVEKARLAAAEVGDLRAGDDSSNPVETIFGAQSLGNVERYAQARELLADVVPFGHGLGAPITSGYNRSVTYPYGFELSFLNVVHKLGVFALFYFAFLLYSGYRILRSPKPVLERSAAMALLGYLFPAIGNPVLFAVQAVFLHMLALHAATRLTEPRQEPDRTRARIA
jgi:hypothetical protein